MTNFQNPPQQPLEPKRIKDVRFSLEIIGQAHTDLSELCSVVCVNESRSVDAFTDLTRIQRNINTVCQTLEGYPTDIAIAAAYETPVRDKPTHLAVA